MCGGIILTPNTTIDGSNSGTPITLSGGGSTRLFHHLAAGSTLTLTHLTLSDGKAVDNGGCLSNEAGTAVLVDVTVTHRQIDAADHQIDTLVYELYGLTAEEVAVVEG